MPKQRSDTVTTILEERGKRYGAFADHSAIAVYLKRRMRLAPGWARLEPDMEEALDMVIHKIGRILNGDPTYQDSWDDICGYSKLVADRLRKDANGKKTKS